MGSNSMSVAPLLLLLLCIGIGIATSSAQVNPQHVVPPKWDFAPESELSCPPEHSSPPKLACYEYQGDTSNSISCGIKCDLLPCIIGCLANPLPGCSIKCLVQGINCQSDCKIIPFPGPSPPPPPSPKPKPPPSPQPRPRPPPPAGAAAKP
ncbi:hypothetical protein PTKIN_Ptkin08bG0001300 [Pterospermum kingtungense]